MDYLCRLLCCTHRYFLCFLFFILLSNLIFFYFFFFQAEDGIRDYKVTGVQTCALPISDSARSRSLTLPVVFDESHVMLGGLESECVQRAEIQIHDVLGRWLHHHLV